DVQEFVKRARSGLLHAPSASDRLAAWSEKHPLTHLELSVVVIVEVLSSCSPLLRLRESAPDSESSTSYLPLLISDYGRALFFLYIALRNRNSLRKVLSDAFTFDNLQTRFFCVCVAYTGLTIDTSNSLGWTIVIIVSEWVFTMAIVAHFRAMIACYK